jgi:hypothetical protein
MNERIEIVIIGAGHATNHATPANIRTLVTRGRACRQTPSPRRDAG